MKKTFLLFVILLTFSVLVYHFNNFKSSGTGAPPYAQEDTQPPSWDDIDWLKDWKRPDGPAKVGLQVGHWQNDSLPDELSRLKGNTGAIGGGKSEWEVNHQIALETAVILKKSGVEVDILPATIPEKYWADVFIAIHADGNEDPNKNGFKIASPRRDFTKKSQILVENIEKSYGDTTKLDHDQDGITRNMTGYYAFAWWRYNHAVHPMTTSAILETGFLTSPHDRKIIVNNYELSAQGLADGIIAYLKSEKLLN